MRITLVSLHTSPNETPGSGDAGGMNVVVREAARALRRLGHDVTLVTRHSAVIPAGRHHMDGNLLVALPVGDPHLTKEHLPKLVGEFTGELLALPEFRRADVVHAHYWLSGVAAEPAARALSIPLVTSFHTVGAEKQRHARSREPRVRLQGEALLTARTVIVAGSESELQAITDAYGAPQLGARLIHPGVDTSLFAPKLSLPPVGRGNAAQGLRITVLGRVQPFKGQDLALDAFEMFVTQYPELAVDATLTIAGEATPGDAAFLEGLRAQAANAELPVTFLPAQSRRESARLLGKSDLVLVPSHSETFGLVALEAAATGTPVIASASGGLREAVSHGNTGMLIEGRDPADWARAIAALAEDRARLHELGRDARKSVASRDWSSHAEQLMNVYESIPR